jgi:WD40 repeat protein
MAYAWAVATNGKLAIAAADGAALKVWGLTSDFDLTLRGDAYVTAVAMTFDGRLAISASAAETLKVWDLRSGRELRTLAPAGTAVAMTPDGKLAISASSVSVLSDARHDHALQVWEVASGRELRKLVGHTSRVNAVAVTPDGQLAMSASDDQTLKVWDVASGNIVCTFTADVAITACVTALDGSEIVAGDGLGRVHFLALEAMGPS